MRVCGQGTAPPCPEYAWQRERSHLAFGRPRAHPAVFSWHSRQRLHLHCRAGRYRSAQRATRRARRGRANPTDDCQREGDPGSRRQLARSPGQNDRVSGRYAPLRRDERGLQRARPRATARAFHGRSAPGSARSTGRDRSYRPGGVAPEGFVSHTEAHDTSRSTAVRPRSMASTSSWTWAEVMVSGGVTRAWSPSWPSAPPWPG